MGGRCLHVDQLQDFNVRSQGRDGEEGLGDWGLALSPRKYIYPTFLFCPSTDPTGWWLGSLGVMG